MKETNQQSLPVFPNCFVCGQENTKGLNRKFTLYDKKSETKFTGTEYHLGYENMIHGGIISALLDDAIVWASYASTGLFGVTAELNIRFLKPVPINQEFTIKGEILEDKGKLLIGRGTLEDDNGDIYAAAKARIIPLKM